jgi:prophage regulatory protein
MSDLIHHLLTIMRKRQVCACIGLSSAQVYAMLDPKSPSYDPTFPTQVRLGASAVGWLEHEIQEWLENRVKLSRAQKEQHEAPTPKQEALAHAQKIRKKAGAGESEYVRRYHDKETA